MSINTNMNPVAVLNDRLRTTFLGGQVLLTEGMQALSEADKIAVIQAVQSYNDFSVDNDPYGEHDFGFLLSIASAICLKWTIMIWPWCTGAKIRLTQPRPSGY